MAILFVPVFGTLSDKLNTPVGRRTPFLILTTLISCSAMLTIPVVVPIGQAISSTSNALADVLVISFSFQNIMIIGIIYYFP